MKFYCLCRQTNSGTVFRQICVNKRIGADNHIIANMDVPYQYCTGSNLNIIANHWCSISICPNRDILPDFTILPYNGASIYYNPECMICKKSTFSYLGFRWYYPPPR